MSHRMHFVGRIVCNVALGGIVIAVAAACKSKPEIDSFTISTATPSSQSSFGPALTPEPQVPYVISGIPHCQGIKDLGYVLKYDWPDIENALEKLADYNWGYYSCSQTQVELKTFIYDKMTKPPYLWQEVAWVEHGNSTGSLYFHSVFRAWIYIWMLRQPGNQNSYLVIAKGDLGMPQTWDCRLVLPQSLRVSLRGAILSELKDATKQFPYASRETLAPHCARCSAGVASVAALPRNDSYSRPRGVN